MPPCLKANRRRFILGASGALAMSLIPLSARSAPADMRAALLRAFGRAPIKDGRVQLKVPALVDNGRSAPLSVSVESPMTADDYVRMVHIFSEKNPLPDVARYHFGPRSGRAEISTRIRLADSQTLMAVAEMNDGSLWSGTAETVITLAACIEMG